MDEESRKILLKFKIEFRISLCLVIKGGKLILHTDITSWRINLSSTGKRELTLISLLLIITLY